MEERNHSLEVVQFMGRLAAHIRPIFPQYAAALVDEIQGKKMTNEKWNRVAAILASLAALPGVHFRQEEHDARNPALSAIAVAQKMAAATFGGRGDSKGSLEFATWYAKEIDEMISKGP